MSGCAPCGRNKGTGAQQPRLYQSEQSFTLTMPDGSAATYGSKLEADAANARAGYTGVVRVSLTGA